MIISLSGSYPPEADAGSSPVPVTKSQPLAFSQWLFYFQNIRTFLLDEKFIPSEDEGSPVPATKSASQKCEAFFDLGSLWNTPFMY
jgi:hypothetical protein